MPLGMLETKVKAIEERVLFPWDVGIWDIVVESDLMIVINALMGSSDPVVFVANIIERTRQKLQYGSINNDKIDDKEDNSKIDIVKIT